MAARLAVLAIILLAWAGGAKSQPLGPWPSFDAGARISLRFAHELVGLPVLAADGAPAGGLRHVFVATDTGAVRDIALGNPTSLSAEDQITLLRWSDIAAIDGRAVYLSVTRSALAVAPRMREVSFLPTTRPEILAEVFDFSVSGSGGSGSSQAPDPTDWTNPPLPADMPSVPTRTGVATTLAPPPMISAEALRGVAVVSQNGMPLGSIAGAALDIAHGHIAFVLIAEADATGQRFLPVPMQSLAPDAAGYSIAREDFWVRQVPRLAGRLPATVGSDWLQALYATFAVPPYWAR
jgi:sporulation protein YlmC with PRC-barrel domain